MIQNMPLYPFYLANKSIKVKAFSLVSGCELFFMFNVFYTLMHNDGMRLSEPFGRLTMSFHTMVGCSSRIHGPLPTLSQRFNEIAASHRCSDVFAGHRHDQRFLSASSDHLFTHSDLESVP